MVKYWNSFMIFVNKYINLTFLQTFLISTFITLCNFFFNSEAPNHWCLLVLSIRWYDLYLTYVTNFPMLFNCLFFCLLCKLICLWYIHHQWWYKIIHPVDWNSYLKSLERTNQNSIQISNFDKVVIKLGVPV